MKENEKTLGERSEESTTNEHGSRRQKMTINGAFNFLMILSGTEARNRNGISQVGSARNETVRIELF